MAKSYIPEESHEEVRQLVLKDPYKKLFEYREMINSKFVVNYKRDCSISKLFERIGLENKSEKYVINEYGDTGIRRLWVEKIDNSDENDIEQTSDYELQNLITGKPIQQTKQIISIPTVNNCERRLCQKLKKEYNFKKITYIPAYQSVCVICHDKTIISKIFDEISSMFEK